MEYQFLDTRVDHRILHITLSREDQLNALNKGMIRELRTVLESVDKDPQDIKGIIITGKGQKAFAAGADIKELTGIGVDEAYVLSQEGHVTFDLIENFRLPIVAAIHGFALGGGFEVALACHIRIGSVTATLGLPES
ncbi:MAG TPA: enoyl-CoA hydratase/isomerase family protein, partial [Membranihabitans sp.]|nr:enoyl-CoA hydratase/isomerase family protein [Membranihabitans sp.]